jgi:hypothetical protein
MNVNNESWRHYKLLQPQVHNPVLWQKVVLPQVRKAVDEREERRERRDARRGI